MKEMKIGTVVNVSEDRSYGFIKNDDAMAGERGIFFHAKDCRTAYIILKVGDKVEYSIVESKKGLVAVGVATV